MSNPGEVAAQTMGTARRYLAILSKDDLLAYRAFVEGVASNPRYSLVDEMMGGLTAGSKLMAVDQVLEIHGRPDGEELIEQERGNLGKQVDRVLKTVDQALKTYGRPARASR